MSKYTTEVRFICETLAGYDESQGYGKIDDIIEAARPKIFDFSYPIYDTSYKSVLEHKILNHYYLREIGMETVGVWKHFLNMKMNEIMPYYNKLYESAAMEYDPLHDVDYYRKHEGKDTGSNESKTTTAGTTHGEGWDYYSDTPQGSVRNLENLTYLTDARYVTNDGTNGNEVTNEGTAENTDEYLDHIYGKMGTGSYAKMIQEYRDTLLNIDMLIIDELGDLFMNLW